jgi:GT2 family glycosyltransferase
MKIVFCLPGNSFTDSFFESWLLLDDWLREQKIEYIVRQASGSNVSQVRERCLRPFKENSLRPKVPFFGEIDYDYIMWIDSDISFKPEHLKKLLDRNVDIVTGVYRMSPISGYACEIKKDILYVEGELIEAFWAGMGFMLVKKGVFEKIEPPWFQTTLADIDEERKEMFVTEDIFFSIRAREAGFKVYIDPEVIVKHKKSILI